MSDNSKSRSTPSPKPKIQSSYRMTKRGGRGSGRGGRGKKKNPHLQHKERDGPKLKGSSKIIKFDTFKDSEMSYLDFFRNNTDKLIFTSIQGEPILGEKYNVEKICDVNEKGEIEMRESSYDEYLLGLRHENFHKSQVELSKIRLTGDFTAEANKILKRRPLYSFLKNQIFSYGKGSDGAGIQFSSEDYTQFNYKTCLLDRVDKDIPIPAPEDIVCGILSSKKTDGLKFFKWTIVSPQFLNCWTLLHYANHETFNRKVGNTGRNLWDYFRKGNKLCTNGFKRWIVRDGNTEDGLIPKDKLNEAKSKACIPRFGKQEIENCHINYILVLMCRFELSYKNEENNPVFGPEKTIEQYVMKTSMVKFIDTYVSEKV